MTDVPAPGGAGVPRRRSAAGGSFTRSFLGAFARGTGLIAVALALQLTDLRRAWAGLRSQRGGGAGEEQHGGAQAGD